MNQKQIKNNKSGNGIKEYERKEVFRPAENSLRNYSNCSV